jgi:hypothetical protein
MVDMLIAESKTRIFSLFHLMNTSSFKPLSRALCLASVLIAPVAGLAQVEEGCFWVNPVVTSSPSNPLTGSGFSEFGGTFSTVNWYSGGLSGDLTGSFAFDVAWDDVDGNGISWTGSLAAGGILFDTSPGDKLLFGSPKIVLDDPECTIIEQKLLICIVPDEILLKTIGDAVGLGKSVFVTDGVSYIPVTESDFSFQLGTGGLGKDASDNYLIDGLYYSFYDGTTFDDTKDEKQNFDTLVKVGACVECVPEPGSWMLILSAGLVGILRRRR